MTFPESGQQGWPDRPGQPGPYPPQQEPYPSQQGPFGPQYGSAPPPQAPYPPPGYPPTGGYPPGGPLGPPPGTSNTTRTVIIAIIAVLVVAGGVTGLVLATGGKKHEQNAHGSAGPTASASDLPSSAGPETSGSGTGPSRTDSEAVVDRYLADINKDDKTDAETLICSLVKDQWKKNLQTPANDFEFKVTNSKVVEVGTGDLPKSTKLTYQLQVVRDGKNLTSTVPFTVIDEDGAKICGER